MVTSVKNNPGLSVLLMAGLDGDKAQYNLFLRQTASYLRRFVARRVPAGDVEDVVQEILLSVHKARHTYDGQRSVLPWVSAIARYRITDYLRQAYKRHAQQTVDIDDIKEKLAAPVTESSEISEYIAAEIAALPERQQKILYLMHTEGFTAQETGTRLDMQTSAVKVAAHRAYRRIKLKLGRT